jgi:LuxR family maltose regulon positive regulatory protein
VLAVLINDLAALPGSFTLVLDDYHLVQAPQVNEAVAFLLDHLPQGSLSRGQGSPRRRQGSPRRRRGLHLVIITREDPHFPLARLRAHGQLSELRAADLRFSLEETTAFLNQVMGLPLSAAEIAALDDRTEGWAAGLQLAAISLQGRQDARALIDAFTGSHRYVLDFLVEEVLEQQPAATQFFLLDTAVLNRLCAPLCDALTGGHNGQAMLDHLVRHNLFTLPLDQEQRWFRYHHLFADLLRRRLHQMDGARVLAMHARAGDWYAQNGYLNDAIEHTLRAEAYERAADLIAILADARQGEPYPRMRRWLEQLPAETVLARPRLALLHAEGLIVAGDQVGAEQYLLAAGQTRKMSSAERQQFDGRIAATRAFAAFYRGDVPAIIKQANQALSLLSEEDAAWRSSTANAVGDAHIIAGNMADAYREHELAQKAAQAMGDRYLSLVLNLKQAITLRQQGRLRHSIDICRRERELIKQYGLAKTAVNGWLLAVRGEIAAEQNDLDRALRQAQAGAELTRRSGAPADVAMLAWSHLCLIRVLFSSGDLDAAAAAIQTVALAARDTFLPPWISEIIDAWQVRLWLYEGRVDLAIQWAAARGLNGVQLQSARPDLAAMASYTILARLHLVRGKPDEAAILIEPLLKAARAGRQMARVINLLLLQAQANHEIGEDARALAALDEALALARPEGFLRAFVDEGAPVANLLRQAAAANMAPAYVRRLLAAFRAAGSENKITHSALDEPLTARELEVLQLIAEGLSNPQVAARLHLTLNTIKAHTRSIYGKLAVHSRTQAVARGRALGILSQTP